VIEMIGKANSATASGPFAAAAADVVGRRAQVVLLIPAPATIRLPGRRWYPSMLRRIVPVYRFE
jgi:hypothetical protein